MEIVNGGVHTEIVNKEVSDRSEEGEKSYKRKGEMEPKSPGETKSPVDLGHQATDQSVKKDIASEKRKMVMEGANDETPANLMVNPVTISDEGNSGNKKGKRKAEENRGTEVDLENKPLNIVESGKKGKKSDNGKEVAGRKGLEVNRRGGDDIKGANSPQKMKIEDESPLVDLLSKITDGSEQGKPGQESDDNEATWKVGSAALHLSFSQGVSLPSRENLISVFSKYGPLIESEIELIRESASAQVVFLRSTDAEEAFNDEAGIFGPPVASYRLKYFNGNPLFSPVVPPVPRPLLPYDRENLERMTSRLHGPSPVENVAATSEGLKPAATNLVDEMPSNGKKGKTPNSGKEVADGKPLDVDHSDGNSLQKKRTEDEAHAKSLIGLVNNITSGYEEKNPGNQWNIKKAIWMVDSAALSLSFSQGISLPSRENLISEFSKYGPLIESDTEMIEESSSARVVFLRYTDAEKAFNDKAGAFGPPVASHRIKYLTGDPRYPPVETPVPPRPSFPCIQKNLERMISQLRGTSAVQNGAGTSGGLNPAAANLVGDMQVLLTKVNQMLGGPDAGTST